MRAIILILTLLLVTGGAIAPALADEDCAAWCGDGKVWDDDKGACVAVPSKTS